MVNRLLPSSVTDDRTLSFESAIDRLMDLDLKALDVYNIDNVPASALYDLAAQFNVLGYRGWLLAEGEQAKRDLIKNSIVLHRVAGTPYAIKLAFESVGYPNIVIDENPGARYDGEFLYDGTEIYRGDNDGRFIITLDSASPVPGQETTRLLLELIEEWKNLRSLLLDLRQNGVSLLQNPLFYDGRITYNNAEFYDGVIEEI